MRSSQDGAASCSGGRGAVPTCDAVDDVQVAVVRGHHQLQCLPPAQTRRQNGGHDAALHSTFLHSALADRRPHSSSAAMALNSCVRLARSTDIMPLSLML